MRIFQPMASIIPEGVIGGCRVRHFEVTQRDSQVAALRGHYTRPGMYCSLSVDGVGLMMSDTEDEKRTNLKVVQCATGDVLIAGLGIGMVALPILKNPKVTTLTIVEKEADVIELVEPHLRQALEPTRAAKLTVIHDDIFTWKMPKGIFWDVIYFDIWASYTTGNLPAITRLKRKFGRRYRLWMGAWQEDFLRRVKRHEVKEERDYKRRVEMLRLAFGK